MNDMSDPSHTEVDTVGKPIDIGQSVGLALVFAANVICKVLKYIK